MYSIDYETKSRSELNDVGTFRYAKDPSTEVLCVSVCKDDGPVLVWIPPEFEFRCDVFGDVVSDPGAKELLTEAMESDEPISAFNVMFEVSITENVLCRLHGFKMPNRRRWRCTQVLARRANIPSSLAKSAEALGLAQRKASKGARLIKQFSVPQKDTNEFIHPRNAPDDFKDFVGYCRQDTVVEREVMTMLKPFEMRGWILDIFLESIEINCRGMPLNLDALRRADAMIEEESGPAFAEFQALTGLSPTQNLKVKAWINSHGLTLDNLQGDTLDAIQSTPCLPGQEDARRAIDLMQKIGFASVKKIRTMLECAGPDDHFIRGSLEFHGASTMRWSGKLHQPQNFKSPEEWAESLTGRMYADLCSGESKESLEWWYGQPIFSILANCIRHFIKDPQGPMLSADYTAIEAMILAWLADEQWRLEVFRTHKKIYEMSASQMFGIPMQEFEDYRKKHGKHHPMRKTGKVAELACIAEGQLVTTDHGLVPIEQVTPDMKVWDGAGWYPHDGVVFRGEREVVKYQRLTATTDHKVWVESGELKELKEAMDCRERLLRGDGRPCGGTRLRRPTPRMSKVYDILNCGPRNRFTVSGVLVHNCGYQGAEGALVKFGALDMGLKEEELPGIVEKWRAANPKIADFWYACERAAIRAVKLPGQKMTVGKLTFFSVRVAGANYLFMKLPSGRNLSYRDPEVKEVTAISKRTGNEYTKSSLSYYGQIPGPSGAKSTKWGRVSLYGGKATENACQAIAFDIMANGTLKAAEKGYRIYSLIHDEALAAFDGPHQSLEEFQSCLEDVPDWCDGLPVSTSGAIVPYYTK